MRYPLLLAVLCILWSCTRKEEKTEPTPPPPADLPDTAFQVTTLTRLDVNEYDVAYRITPAPGATYHNVYLSWSTSPDFSSGKDSVLVASSVNTERMGKHPLRDLRTNSRYYTRISLQYQNRWYASPAREWQVDSLRITMVFHTSLFPVVAHRGTNVHIRTNSGADTTQLYHVDTKVFLGPYSCPVRADKGSVVYFDIPKTISPGRYRLKLERKGLTTQTPDSVFVYAGFWKNLPTPAITVQGLADANNSVIDYGSCYSATHGYILGGTFIHPASYTSFTNEPSRQLLVFDATTNSWTSKTINNARNMERPNTFYYNNGVYVLGGVEEWAFPWFSSRQTIRNVWRLDLASMNWSRVDTLPYSTRYNPVSFELNGEWYIGMGTDSANRSTCCGDPLPDKDFWKYNPAAGTWARIADFPGSHQTFPTAFSIGSKAYVFLGDLRETDHELWEYDPAADTWRRIQLPANSGLLRGEKYSVVTYNGKAYFLSAQVRFLYANGYGHSLQYTFLEFDPHTAQFNKINSNTDLSIVKPIYQSGNRVVLQTNVFGYIEKLPENKTTELTIE